MYIIAIAWLFVVSLTAIANPRPLGGILTFLFAGLLPLALFLWLFGTSARRRAQARAALENAAQPADTNQTSDANRPVTPSRR